MSTSSKIIVTNQTALKAKYGKSNYDLVVNALNTLIAADQGRGITTTVIYLDDATQMKQYDATPVTSAGDEKQNKTSIDQLCTKLAPDYIMILDAQDIVPFQTLVNTAGNDGDRNVPSDLPYASSSPYSTSVKDFLNPTRVVGRLPGIYKSKDPSALIAGINTSASLVASDRSVYDAYLAVSAAVWENSTKESVTNIFGNATALQLSPPEGPNWTAAQLKCRAHFVNCHGSGDDPHWYGQSGNKYPVAFSASEISGKEVPGTIVAVECCYGAQLYSPGGICNTYLKSSVCGFCGSTNIAYGPSSGNGEADLITQYFMINALAGASVGRAMLQARQTYIAENPVMGNYDLKTIAQFLLLGDPSSQPVKTPPQLSKYTEVKSRRFSLAEAGDTLGKTARYAVVQPELSPSPSMEASMRKIIEEIGIRQAKIQTSTVEGGLLTESKHFSGAGQELIHEISGELEIIDDKFANRVGVIIMEKGGEFVSSRVIYSKG